MTDWNELARQALRQIDADKTLVPGAKIRPQLDALAAAAGEDLTDFLDSRAMRLGEFLSTVPGVVIRRRPGTDILVGFDGASEPLATSTKGRSPRLRKDVYEALTRISDTPYRYLPQRDEFTLEAASDEPSVQLPLVTLDRLLEDRRAFSEQQEEPRRAELLASIDRSPNPLASFQRAVHELGLSRPWFRFKSQRLEEILRTWAADNDLEPSPTWYTTGPRELPVTPQEILAIFSHHMTEHEIRSMAVPFRAVEAMFRDLTRPKRR